MNKENISLAAIEQAKQELQSQIQKSVNLFEEKTQCHVEAITIDRTRVPLSNGTHFFMDINTKVTV